MAIEQVDLAQLFDSNIYLVSGDRTVLIDSGIGFQWEDINASVRKMLNGRKLDILILTHRHYDHVGGANAIIKEFGPSEVYTGKGDAEPLRKGDRASTLGERFGGALEPMDVKELGEGDIIDIGGHRLRAIATPGHTIGSICLFDEVTGALFSGDTVFVGGIGRCDLPTGNADQLIDSLKKLNTLKINGFYPGHGPAVPKGGNVHITNGLRMMGVRI
ncbi:MAG: MBL fold metallo-hydrolase [Methanomassiliicoccaceae archaeon]|jgi:glyoxylase-like metal-dependent hydrolase (beta-lactamase superfamily II)|nr:MBL fold metallo-hydrolase [Methanomassiliicoccaceae archaeon]